MTEIDCGTVRERIPGVAAETLAARDSEATLGHVAGCRDCAAELALARLLFGSRPTVPGGLAGRVKEAVRYDRTSVRRPWWGLSAAAVAALALGIGFATDRPGPGAVPVPGYAYETDGADLWLQDDGLVAGAPSLEGLSEETLERLLDELAGGGAA